MKLKTFGSIIFLLGLTLTGRAFDPGNLRYQFPCKAMADDRPEFAAAEFNDSAWPDMMTFMSRVYQLENSTLPGVIVWNRIHMKIGADFKNKDLTLAIADGQVLAGAWLNGKPLPACSRQPRRMAFALPPELIRYDGENIVALRYYNFAMPREDTLGRVELREAEPLDRVHVGLGGAGFIVASRTDVFPMSVSSGLCREQNAKVLWRVEDYFGAELTNGVASMTLAPLGKPGAAKTVNVKLPQDDAAYKVVAWPETDKGAGPESWGYIGRRDRRGEFRTMRLLDKGWDFAQVLGVKELKPPVPRGESLDDDLKVLSDPDKETRGIDGSVIEPFAWRQVNLPHILSEDQRKAHRMWYRLPLSVPSDMAGKRIALWFYQVSYQVEVFVDNQFVGRKPMWEMPGEIDLTGKVKPGGTNMLWLGVTDFVACVDPAAQARWADGNNKASGLLAPVNGFPFMKHSGIPCVPELRAYPLDARLDWIGVESVVDVPKKIQRLKGTVRVANTTAVDKSLTVQAEVLLRGKLVKTLPPQTLTVKGNSMADALIETEFPEGQCWTLDSPTLYQLRTRLVDGGKAVDQTDTRFGFRQFGTDGRSITMNGFPMRIMGSDQWRPHTNPRLKGTIDMVRLSPSIEQCYSHCVGGGELDVYDETGCLVLADDLDSNACTRNNWAWEDARLYKNIASKFRSLITQLYNHPSIVIWAWGCEFPFYCAGRISDAAVKMACEAEADVQKADPTRFASFTSLGRGRGFSQARLLSNHSEAQGPGEYATMGLWYFSPTNDVPEYLRDLLGRELAESGSYGWMSKEDMKQSRFWDGVKPVFNCETSYTGWDCDTDDQLYCALPGGFWMRSGAWFQSEVARGNFYRLGQTWTRGSVASTHCAEGAGEEALARAVVFPKYWEDKYWGGTKTNLPIFVVNNYLWPEDVRLTWGLYAQDGRKLEGGEKTWSMAPSCLKDDSLPLDLPPVKEAEYVRLIYTVESKTGGVEYRGWERLTVFPACDLKAASKDLRIALYDPAGATAEALKKAGVEFDLLKGFGGSLAGYRLLIIGENAVDDAVGQARETLRQTVSDGLTCAIWFQDRRMTNFPMTVARGGDLSGFAYLTYPEHPLVKGLLHSDFRWWRNPWHDPLVLIHSVGIPMSENARRIVNGGLTEVPLGKGRFISYQFPLVRDLATEPVAARLVENMLLTTKVPPAPVPLRQLFALEADMTFVSGWAKKVGLTVKAFPPSDPSRAVLLARGQTLLPMTNAQIKSFLGNGGILWMSGVDTNVPGSGGTNAVTLDAPVEPGELANMLEEKLNPVSWLAKTLNISVRTTKLKAPQADEEPRRALRKYRAPILAGIAGCDLGRDIGETTLTLDEPGFKPLLEPSFLVVRPYEKGMILLDNVFWPIGRSDMIFFQLGWNLGLRSETVSAREGEHDGVLESLDTPLQGIAPLPDTK